MSTNSLVHGRQRQDRLISRIDEILAADGTRSQFRSRQDVLYEAVLRLWRELRNETSEPFRLDVILSSSNKSRAHAED
jgi:hypothetical protein